MRNPFSYLKSMLAFKKTDGKPDNINLDDAAFYALYDELYGPVYQSDPLIEIIKSNSKPGSIIYDVGAAHGTYSVYLARNIAEVKIYAFEPYPGAYGWLTDYTVRFGLKGRIIAFNVAISDKVGKSELYISTDLGRCSLHQYNAASDGHKIVQSVNVRCDTLDRMVISGKCPRPDIIKIDTEGHEYEVLKGAEQIIKKYHPKIFYEPHGNLSETSGKVISSEARVVELLSQYGYSFVKYGYPIYCY